MGNYLRIALAQIKYHPAYKNLLMEPTGEDIGLNLLGSSVVGVKASRKYVYDKYLDFLSRRVISIIDKCSSLKVNIVVFPEYSIPSDLLLLVKELSIKNNIFIVAGSHMVTQKCANHYKSIGFDDFLENDEYIKDEYIRQAMCPVVMPNEKIYFVPKTRPSKFEPDLEESQRTWDWISIDLNDYNFNLGVMICVDFLSEALVSPQNDNPCLIVVPSWSPKTAYFSFPANYYRIQGKSIIYVNEATIGGSKIFGYCDKNNKDIFLDEDGTIAMPSNDEVILVADVDIEGQYNKSGVVTLHKPIKIVSIIPILNNLHERIFDSLNKAPSLNSTQLHLELDSLASIKEQPSILNYKLTFLSEIIEEGIAKKEDVLFFCDYIFISENPLEFLEYEFLKVIQKAVAPIVTSDNFNRKALEVLNNISRKLDQIKKCYPSITAKTIITPDAEQFSEVISDTNRPYIGRDNAIKEMREFINNENIKTCFVFGIRGIGKTAFVNEGINYVLPSNWKKIVINITEGTGFNRFILSLLNLLEFIFDEKEIITQIESNLESLFKNIFDRFNSLPSAVLIIDDWHYTFSRGNYFDIKFDRFIKYSAKTVSGSKNKIFITSPFKFKYPEEGFANIVLEPLEEQYIRGIIDWNLKLFHGNKSIYIPIELINRLHGNPLAAKFISQLLEKYPMQSIIDNTTVQKRFQDRLIPLLLARIDLMPKEIELVRYISVYNVPFEFEVIDKFVGDESVEMIDVLTDHFLLEFNIETGLYQMHPIIKEYFVNQIPLEIRIEYHKHAVEYYESKIKQSSTRIEDYGELVSHLAQSLQYEKVQEYKEIFMDEIRPVALRLFRGKEFRKAIEYYKILEGMYPEDVDIKFKIGLCYGNLEFWREAEHYINLALGKNRDAWWVLAGYGDLLSRKRKLDQGEKYLNQSIEIANKVNVPEWRYSAIYQSLANVFEKRKIFGKAEEFYKSAIDFDKASAFARYAYAKYLYKQKNYPDAITQLKIAEELDSSLKQVKWLKEQISSTAGNGLVRLPDEDEVVNEDDFEDNNI
ncbi:Archaeal ATPase [Pelotomaculum schinkii]|uniref:Archaeal ATPase n=1 Tax=Pelotomaculum schinkii TaxID=78350 RepID=A0A4Y7R920_9FIRM|nr:hypothetical protein [Pelotomaculum schinkii]TEB05455.1 Archaeal ATPase [Pelotomaculum schinkii]